MRASLRRALATHARPRPGSTPLRQDPVALLPPIPLYRRLLRAHRKHLGPEERVLGDQYVKSEFRQHKNVENPLHIIGFLTEWQTYAQKLEGDMWKDELLDRDKLDKMSDQQIGQLHELMAAIHKQAQEDDGDGGEDGTPRS